METKEVAVAVPKALAKRTQKGKEKETQTEKKNRAVAIACTCWEDKRKHIELAKDEPPNEDKEETRESFLDFILARDYCDACQAETPRDRDKCTCSPANEQLKSLYPPLPRPQFPTTFQLASAELDWKYERLRCHMCKEGRSDEAMKGDFEKILAKKFKGSPGWMNFHGVPLKIIKVDESDDEEDAILLKLK